MGAFLHKYATVNLTYKVIEIWYIYKKKYL